MNRVKILIGLVVIIFLGLNSNNTHAKNMVFDVDHWLSELENRASEQHGDGIEKGARTPKGDRAEEIKRRPPHNLKKDKEIKRITIDFYKMDLHNVFRLLGEISGKNIVVDESISGTITLALKDVPWTFVLDVIKSLKGLSSIEKYNTIMIFPAGKRVTWGVGGQLEGKGALEVKKSPELIVPEVKKRAGLIVKKEYGLKTSLAAVKKAMDLVSKGKKAEANGYTEKALHYYKEAAGLWPDNEGLFKKIATLALANAHMELEAFNYAKMALKVDPRDSEGASLAGVALARMGRNDEAIKYFERAATSPDANYETLCNYAVFLFSNGLYRDAVRILNRMETRFPITPEFALLRAKTYESLGQFEKAVSQYITIVNGGETVPLFMKEFARSRLKKLADKTERIEYQQ